MNTEQITNFEKAFTSHGSSIVMQCECKRVFYVSDSSEGWDEGEFERLYNDPTNTALEYAPGGVVIDGGHYCSDCDCWHKKAAKIIKWLENNAQEVAEFFRLEKLRLQAEADAVPVIEP